MNKNYEEKIEQASIAYCPDDAYPYGPDVINKIVRDAFKAGAKCAESIFKKEIEKLEKRISDYGWQYEADHVDDWRKPHEMGQ